MKSVKEKKTKQSLNDRDAINWANNEGGTQEAIPAPTTANTAPRRQPQAAAASHTTAGSCVDSSGPHTESGERSIIRQQLQLLTSTITQRSAERVQLQWLQQVKKVCLCCAKSQAADHTTCRFD